MAVYMYCILICILDYRVCVVLSKLNFSSLTRGLEIVYYDRSSIISFSVNLQYKLYTYIFS